MHYHHQFLRRWDITFLCFVRRGEYRRLYHRIPALGASVCLPLSGHLFPSLGLLGKNSLG